MALSDLAFHCILIFLLYISQRRWFNNKSKNENTKTLLPLFTISLLLFCIYFHESLNFALAGISGLVLSNALLLLWLEKSDLNIQDFLLFYWASETRGEIDLAIAKAKKVLSKAKEDERRVRAELVLDSYRRIEGPVIAELAKVCATCVATILILPVLLEGKPALFPPFQLLSPLDLELQFYYLLHGLTLYCCIELTYSLVGASFAYYFGIPMRRSFLDPFKAKTVGDLWSRWNIPVQIMLKKGAYDPFYSFLSRKKVPLFLAKAFAVMATFFTSALYHEFIVFFTKHPNSSHPMLEQCLFFMIHALVVIFENAVLQAFKSAFKIDLLKRIPGWILQLYVLSFTLCTSPLMLNPYLRERVYHNLMF